MPSIQTLKTGSKKHFDSLELFAYGTWGDYAKNKTKYIALSEKRERKLRILTLCQLALQQSALSYEQIGQACGLPNDIDRIEDLVLATVQSQLIECRIDQRRRLIHILSVSASATAGREVPQESIPAMLAALRSWEATNLAKAQETFEKKIRKELDDSVLEGHQEQQKVTQKV